MRGWYPLPALFSENGMLALRSRQRSPRLGLLRLIGVATGRNLPSAGNRLAQVHNAHSTRKTLSLISLEAKSSEGAILEIEKGKETDFCSAFIYVKSL